LSRKTTTTTTTTTTTKGLIVLTSATTALCAYAISVPHALFMLSQVGGSNLTSLARINFVLGFEFDVDLLRFWFALAQHIRDNAALR
jgi:hypothetical protein